MNYKNIMKVARGEVPAQLVLKNAQIVNVYNKKIEFGDIAIEGKMIVGVGSYEGVIEHDMKQMYVAPGFIDGHVHIESSMLTPPGFAKIVVPKGTTTVIADPHEIGNVSGIEGVKFMLDSSENIPLNVYMMLPSCVPAIKDENNGAVIAVQDLESLKDHQRVLGLGEVMDYPSVISGQWLIHKKIRLMKEKIIDGHAPDILGKDLNAYLAAGVMTDHECTNVESMIERIRLGMYVHLREGSATRNVKALLKGLTKDNLARTLFCTDDKHPHDIKKEGHINFNVNLAIKAGVDPIDAVSMATINAANCYGLVHIGGIAPNKNADLIVFSNLEQIEPETVYHHGKVVAKNGYALFDKTCNIPKTILDTIHIDDSQLNFELKLKNSLVNVIGLIKNNITTKKLIREVNINKNNFIYNPEVDILKLAVIERHNHTGNIAVGLVEGFGFTNGALAMTVAHDSHNLIIVGSSDCDMKLAALKIKEIKGGLVLVSDGEVIDYLKLEVGGIMTTQPVIVVEEALLRMKEKMIKMGLNTDVNDPFISLAFLALPVIPVLKLTDRGLFDVNECKIVPIEAEQNVKN